MNRSGWVTRTVTTAIVVVVAAVIWGGVPGVVAAGTALDHPAWSDPTRDPGNMAIEDSTSWWPPGRRYAWIGGQSGRKHTAVDPWTHLGQGHAWTAAVLLVTGAIVLVIWVKPRRRSLGTSTTTTIQSRK